jgi:hypothetical protein
MVGDGCYKDVTPLGSFWLWPFYLNMNDILKRIVSHGHHPDPEGDIVHIKQTRRQAITNIILTPAGSHICSPEIGAKVSDPSGVAYLCVF